ncbi:YybS family protein [Oceanobacillus salinisoli]|uniref:YybS family protein n=1 Tax=Oceanobacillus salinisoli TaxID=2678611 RepID=UPI0012E14FBD|nr:YybS family protein [Oceanobacillus salinisoli]
MNQSKKLTDGALMLAIFMVLLFITIFIPLLSIISVFLLPVPFVIYASKYNWKPSLLMLALAVILSVMFATIFSLPTPIMMGLGGIMIGSAIYKNLSAYETLARGTFGFVIGLLFLFVFSQVLFQVNIVEDFRVMISDSLEMSTSILEDFGAEGQADEFQEMIQLQIDYIIDLLPVFVLISALVFALVSQWASYKILNRLEKLDLHFPPFRTLRMPSSIIWIYLVVLFLTLMDLNQSGTFFLIVQNVQVLASILLAIQGFSFIFYYAHHKKLSKAIPIISIVLTVLLPIVFLTIVRIIGIIDIGFNMRERLMKNK